MNKSILYMASKGVPPGSSFLSLAGYLDLQHKSWRGKQRKRYWFWFDEQTCQLKYYRNQEAYQHGVFEPLMAIDLRHATITPPMAAEELAADQFQINSGGQSYILAAVDMEMTHSWIRKLQDKREQWIHRDSALGMTDQDRQTKKKALQPPHERPGVLLPDREDVEQSEEPTTVRKIMSRHMRLASRHSLPLEELPSYHDNATRSSSSSVTAAYFEPSAEPNSTDERCQSSEGRELLKLHHEYLASQEEVMRLQKELVQLKERMEKKDEKTVKLNYDIDLLSEELAKSKSVRPPNDSELEVENLKDIIEQYKRSVKSLVDEIELKRLNETEFDRRVNVEKTKVNELEKEVNMFKAKFVHLLSDKFKVVVPNPSGAEEEGEDAEEEVYKEELLQLLQRESDDNDILQYKSSFKDEYGDWHDWQSDTTVPHYLCRQLYLHYTQHEAEQLLQEWADFLKPLRNIKGTPYTDLLPSNDRVKRRELCSLLRKGIPLQYRTRVWSSLVYRLIGRIKEVKDCTAGSEKSYYTSLLNSKNMSPAEKQIELDLHRTLPSNVHFRSKGHGAQKLKNVLIAYSHHNKNVGYCQGMNLIAAIALLFLDEETTFWFLQAVIEKLLPAGYFTPGLLGAQADQALMRELLPQKLSRLSTHLDLHSIDVTLITFNWFLTLFIDAMPTQSVLRILDCFLFEGSKVLFRVALGVLKVNASRLLSITDPVGLFQTLKEIAKHSFDCDHLLKVAFTGMEPFPRRSVIVSRHSYHYGIIREQWLLRERELKERESRNRVEKMKKPPLRSRVLERSFRETQRARRHLVWECGCVRVRGEGVEEIWLCCGDRQQGRIAIISATDGEWNIRIPRNDVGSRVISVGYVQSDVVVLGTLDFNLYAFHCTSQREVWSMKMPDSVLAIQSTEDCTVFAALADGFVAVLQRVTSETPDSAPLLIHIGSGAVLCLALDSLQQLWCGCGNAITILSSQSFEPIHSIGIEELKGQVYKMVTSQHGVWVSFRSTSTVGLYDNRRCVQLLQLDYTSLLPPDISFTDRLDSRITSMLVAGQWLWVGTGKGLVLIFNISRAVPETETAIAVLAQKSSETATLAAEEHSSNGTGHGLLTAELAETSPIIEEPNPGRTARSDYYHNRRTAFGRTLRGPSMKQAKLLPAVFQLQYENSYHLAQAESVKVLLSMGRGSLAVSCLHSVADWAKGVQGWACHDSPDKWSFEHLPISPDCIQDLGDPGIDEHVDLSSGEHTTYDSDSRDTKKTEVGSTMS